MGQAHVPVELVRGVPVVAAPEEIDVTNADDLRAALLEAGNSGFGRFVVDMTRTRFCDSSGVHTLARAHRRALDDHRGMLLAVCHPAVLRVLEITGIGRIIPTCASLEEALGHATGDGTQRPGARPAVHGDPAACRDLAAGGPATGRLARSE